MRIAVLGGGTAGFIAAAHLTHKLPRADLLHIFDSRFPTIGVGEGTTPRFPLWLKEVAGLDPSDMIERCGATLKTGTRFEGWGSDGREFLNRFQPPRLIGYHFDASRVVRLIAEYVRAQQIDTRVVDLQTLAAGVDVHLEDGTVLSCDYVFDARGFPPETKTDGPNDEDIIRLDWIPTGRALLRWLAPGDLSGVSRAVARPHGWVFQIPLQDRISCGYVYNPRISSDAEVETDFTYFLNEEGVENWDQRGMLSFPNFLRRRLFDGRVFQVGNAASFVEPLEATLIGAAILQVRAAQRWIDDHDRQGVADPSELERYNSSMRSYILRNSLFVAWHYACGSRWDTAFWRYARCGVERARGNEDALPHLTEMEEFVEAGRDLPSLSLSACDDQDQWDREIYPLLRRYVPFGNFSELNFAQVGHGIGYYHVPQDAEPIPHLNNA